MISLPFKIIHNQFLHISEHRSSYFRILLPAILAWCLCTFSINMKWPAMIFISGLFAMLYIFKFTLQSIRFVVLDETPTYFFRLKFFKQGFLYLTYMYLIFIWTIVVSVLVGYCLIMINPDWLTSINQSIVIPHQDEIAHQIAQATSAYNMPVAAQNQESIINFFYHMTVFIGFIVQGLLAFNLIAVAADEQIPFYRMIWQAGRFQFANLVFSLLLTFMPALLSLVPINDFNGDHINFVQFIFVPIYNLIFWFLVLCIAQNYSAWKNHLEG